MASVITAAHSDTHTHTHTHVSDLYPQVESEPLRIHVIISKPQMRKEKLNGEVNEKIRDMKWRVWGGVRPLH